MSGIIPKLSITQILSLCASKVHEGSEDTAILLLREWLTYNGDKPDAYMAWYELGLSLYHTENFDSAQTCFKSALLEGHRFPAAAQKLGEMMLVNEEQSNDPLKDSVEKIASITLH